MKFELSKEYQFILIPTYMVLITVLSQPPYFRPKAYILPILAIWSWYLFLTSAYEVEITAEETINAKSILKKTIINPEDTIWIKETILFLTVKHSCGKIKIPTLINNITGIKSFLKSKNPKLETKYRTYRGGTYK